MFATHYHELTALEDCMDSVKNYNIAVKKNGDDITFLRRIIRGGADDSFGIEVAKLAGVPNQIVARAKEILKELESMPQAEVTAKSVKKPKMVQEEAQISFTPAAKHAVLEKLEQIDVNTLTPIECMQTLFELSQLAKQDT